MTAGASISIIIPTYNRAAFLRQTLASLARQSMAADSFEVILVGDGSEDETRAAAGEAYPFRVRYVWQANQGDAVARNTGAARSAAELLVFIDDDIIVDREYVAALARAHERHTKRIVAGTEYRWLEPGDPLTSDRATRPANEAAPMEMAFADLCSNNMSIRREAYFGVGTMETLGFTGSSMWCDVDFAYRAKLQGFEFVRSPEAICWHRDYVALSLANQTKRTTEAAYRAAALFQKHPALLPHIPMFHDKTPVAWGQDPPRLMARKIGRQLASSRPVLVGMETLVAALDRFSPSSGMREAFARWIVGGHAFQGYRRGLRELGEVGGS
jgi:glycosyltransferase involved in cell wall biosynthesis